MAKTIGKPAVNLYECTVTQEEERGFLTHGQFKIDIGDRLRSAKKRSVAQQVILGIRPEHIEVLEAKETNEDIPATISISELLGSKTIVDFKIGEETIRAVTPTHSKFQIRESRWLRFKKERVFLFEKESGEMIL